LSAVILSLSKDEIGPIHRHRDFGPWPDDLADPRSEQVPGDNSRVAQQPVDLLDRRLGDQSARRRQRLTDQGHRQRRPRHNAEHAIGQRKDALRMQVVDEHAVQKIMNKIKSLLRRSHRFPAC
jgi:hypothetical protein